MATTAAGRRLTEVHRLAQARLGQQSVSLMARVWPLLDGFEVDATFERWLEAATPIVRNLRDQSSQLAANYVTTFRDLEGIAGAVTIVRAEPIATAKLATSLLVTGPVDIKRATARGVPLARAMTSAQAKTAGAAMRHILDGGRGTTIDSLATDRQALGWARATSGQPCAFCAMLAGRGPVYFSEQSGDFKPHDACHCSAEPVYRDDAPWPAGSDRYAEMWKAAKAEPGDTTNNFRRALEGGAGA